MWSTWECFVTSEYKSVNIFLAASHDAKCCRFSYAWPQHRHGSPVEILRTSSARCSFGRAQMIFDVIKRLLFTPCHICLCPHQVLASVWHEVEDRSPYSCGDATFVPAKAST